MSTLDTTHDPALRSWVGSANPSSDRAHGAAITDFPIQNLPFGRFRPKGGTAPWRIGVAIGDQVLDLRAAGPIHDDDINTLMARSPAERQALRAAISAGLAAGSGHQATWTNALLPQSAVELGVPCRIGDYTDFYTGIHHATAIGKLFRPDNPLLPNYRWVPIGYHGRASSIVASGTPIRRPRAQVKPADADMPHVAASQRLDYELELGFLIAAGNALGEPITIDDAEAHLFGVTLLNDWSARDVQPWEYQPLGPFLSKNFASTLSPWIVTAEALAPFRSPFQRAAGEPQPLPYLDGVANRAQGQFDIQLQVWLQTAQMREAGEAAVRLTQGNSLQAAYWTAAQLIAHHTVGGCNLQPGDLLGSGTLSGPEPSQAGSMMELSAGGKRSITLPNGETRSFLQDGDTLGFRARCEREGAAPIGFGSCEGQVLPARAV